MGVVLGAGLGLGGYSSTIEITARVVVCVSLLDALAAQRGRRHTQVHALALLFRRDADVCAFKLGFPELMHAACAPAVLAPQAVSCSQLTTGILRACSPHTHARPILTALRLACAGLRARRRWRSTSGGRSGCTH